METTGRYYGQVLLMGIVVAVFSLLLGPLAPISEPLLYSTRVGVYDLAPPVYLSFAAFVSLMFFIVSAILFWGSKSKLPNLLIDGSGLSLIALNYINFFVIWEIWRPVVYPVPFFLIVQYNGAKALQLDWAQIAAVIVLYRLYRYHLRPHRLSEPESKQ